MSGRKQLRYFVIRNNEDNNLMQMCFPIVGSVLHGKSLEMGFLDKREPRMQFC